MSKTFHIKSRGKNGNRLRSNNPPPTGLLRFRFVWQMFKGVLFWPVKEFPQILNFGQVITCWKTFQIVSWNSYRDKLLFIAIPFGAQDQQGSTTPQIFFVHAHANFGIGQFIFSLGKKFPPPPPFSTRDDFIARFSGSSYITWEMSPGPNLEG